MAWTIEYSATATRELRKLDQTTRRRLRELLYDRVALLDDPCALGKPLTGPLSGYWTYRVGDYRVICEIQDRRVVILVLRIGNRRDVYR